MVCNVRYGPEYLSIVASQKRCNKATLSQKLTPRLIFDLLSKSVSRFERKTKESGEAIQGFKLLSYFNTTKRPSLRAGIVN